MLYFSELNSVNICNGYIVVDNASEDKFSLKIPNTELYSHFVFIS